MLQSLMENRRGNRTHSHLRLMAAFPALGVMPQMVRVHDLALRCHLPTIIAETAYNWTPGDFIGKKPYFRESPDEQKEFRHAVTALNKHAPH